MEDTEMINDSPLANSEDRIRDLIMNIEEMKSILNDIYADIEADGTNDGAEIMELLESASDSLDSAAESLDTAGSLMEL